MKWTITNKLLFCFLLLGLLPVALSFLSYWSTEKILREEILDRLIVMAEDDVDRIIDYIQYRERDISTLSHMPVVVDSTNELDQAFKNFGLDSPEYEEINEKFYSFAASYQEMLGYSDFLIVDVDGNVIFSVKHDLDFGSNIITGVYKNTELANVFRSAQTGLETDISVFKLYGLSGKPTAFIGAPILKQGKLIGVVVLRINPSDLYGLAQEYRGLGKTGETVIGTLEGDNIVFVAPLRHGTGKPFSKRIPLGSKEAVPIQKAVLGQKGEGVSVDYNGNETLAVWRYLPHLEWGIVVKIDADEAFQPITALRIWFISICGFVLIALILVILFISRMILRPIKDLHARMEIVRGGNLDYEIKIESNDELGELSRAFEEMIRKLKKTTSSRDELEVEIETRKQAQEEAQKKSEELEKMNEYFVGREVRMAELKKEMDGLKKSNQKLLEELGEK